MVDLLFAGRGAVFFVSVVLVTLAATKFVLVLFKEAE